MTLKIKPAPIPPEKRKITFKLPEPTISDFETYLTAYAETYGVEADPSFVANEIFVSFFDSDKGFRSFLNKDSTGASPGPAATRVKKQQAQEQLTD